MPYAFHEEEINALKDLAERLEVKHVFKPGDIIRWKKGMRNRRAPAENGIAIVLEVLDEPIIHPTKETGETYFGEILDIRVGLIDERDGNLLCYMMPSRLFEPVAN